MKYTKTCECCGETFQTSQPRKQLCDKQHYKKCVVCGSEFPVNKRNWKTKKFCSRECTEQWYRENGKYEEFAKKANETKKRKYYGKGITFNAPKHTRVCKLCGKEFQPRNANQQICDDDHYKTCVVCGKKFKTSGKRIRETCSEECRYEYSRQQFVKKYGTDNPAKVEQFKKKSQNTCMSKYGVPFVFQSEQVKKKTRETCLRKYGVPYSAQSSKTRQSYKETCISRYSYPSFLSVPKVRERISNTMKAKYGVPWYCMTPEYQDSRHPGRVSNLNIRFADTLKVSGCEVELEFPVENRLFDIKAGDVLVEVDPTFTHNSYVNCCSSSHEGLSPNYHLNKSKLAESHGYRCIHVWDWDDWEKVVGLVLPTSRRLFARKCQVVELDKEATDKFLRDNHLQGTCKGQTVRLGLTYNDELVEVMTFGKPRYNRKFEWELLRLCALPGTSVVGGPSKLFSHFVKKCNPKSVLSYCDRSKFTGNVYESIGMTLADEGTPNKHWYSPRKSERMQHVTNNFLLQRGFDQIFGTSYGKGTNNEQLMLERGYLPVYDCGQMRFEWHSS